MTNSITEKNGQFHIRGKNTSYIFSLFENKYLLHNYWGTRLENDIDFSHQPSDIVAHRATAFHTPIDAQDKNFLSDQKLEFATAFHGDYRVPSFMARFSGGNTVNEFVYDSYTIIKGRKPLKGLPHIYTENDCEAETLEITLKDEYRKIRSVLCYTVFPDYDVITRSMRIENYGAERITLLSVQSCCVDFFGMDYKLLHLPGDWLRERDIEYTDVTHGIYTVDSKRGMSSHTNNPFVALCSKNTDEYTGEVYGFSLVYSGSFAASVEGSSTGSTRVTMGINSFNFEYPLNAGDAFQTPEAVLIYSPCGLTQMSRKYHKIFRERLVRGKYRDAVRPVLANSWEAVETNFDEEKLLKIAQKAAELECEMFVIDDGWYEGRNNDKTSLGDWTADRKKLPSGLNGLCKKINAMGLQLGIWFEPEMVNLISKLYKAHPDWVLYAEGCERTANRNQLVLDLSRKEVQDYLYDSVAAVLNEANITYVKWDCNRNMAETQDPARAHDYVLGLYNLLERLTADFPYVLFESCSGGGGRFDPGMLYYMPQTWTSDNTRVRGRIKIQYATSLVYPMCTMAAHIAKINPNADKNDKYLNANAVVSMSGLMGFEFDLSKINDNVKEQSLEYVRLYKSIRETVICGEMYRIENPFESQFASWEIVDKKRVLLFYCQKESTANGEERKIRLYGLENSAQYSYEGKTFYGEELMKYGFVLPMSVYENESGLIIFEKRED